MGGGIVEGERRDEGLGEEAKAEDKKRGERDGKQTGGRVRGKDKSLQYS